MNEMYLRFPEGRKKAFTISYDDNVTQDERLIRLMEKYKIKGTFNIIGDWFAKEDDVFLEGETYINVTEKKARELYNNSYVEVANHGMNHTKMTNFPSIHMMAEIVECRKKLESMFGHIVTGFAYPYGLYHAELQDLLEKAGIMYARTVCSTYRFDLPEFWLEWNPTCHHADPKMSQLTNDFLEIEAVENPFMYYVWGHTFEFDQQDNWEIIEHLFEQVSGREDIWYATNGELCTYKKAYDSLVYSADLNYIYNPTATDVWVEIDKVIYFVPAGKEILR